MKKLLLCAAGAAFLCMSSLAGIGTAADTGPEQIVFETKKPVVFPHKAHQAKNDCGTCHHTKGDDGKQAPYTEGMAIQKCNTCHNPDSGMPGDLNSLKGVGHTLCKDCHKKSDNKELSKCNTCHSKK